MRLIAVLALAFVTLAAPAAADQGRALLETGFPPQTNPDAGAGQAGVALPDGGAVLFGSGSFRRGMAGVRMTPEGMRDSVYSARIVDRNALLVPAGALLRPDGRIVVTAARYEASVAATSSVIAAQFMPDGTLDPSFAGDGVTDLGLLGGTRPALAPDGTLVVTGTGGDPGIGGERRWMVASVSPTGQVMRRVVPGSQTGDGGIGGVAVAPDGRVTAAGYRGRRSLVARLLPDGTTDPAWNGGAPVDPGVKVRDLALGPDGAVTLLGDIRLARLRQDGTRDAEYGTVRLRYASFARLLAEPGGGVLVSRSPSPPPRPASQPGLIVDRVSASGAVTTVTPRIRLGGGAGAISAIRLLPLRQSGFAVGELLRRPDGSFLVAGSVGLVQYTGEGEGVSSARHGLVALTPQLTVDRSFGPAFGRPRLSVRVGRLERSHFVLRLRVRGSGPGMLAVRVRDRRGRTVARGPVPVHRAGRQTVRVGTTAAGRRILRRRTAVRLTGRFRDLATREVAVPTARGRIGG